MGAIGMIVKIYSYVFHLVLALFLTAVSLVAFLSGIQNVRLDMLPWTGVALSWWLLGLGLAGLAIVALAVKGTWRILFLIWNLGVVAMLIRAYVFSPYTFEGWEGFRMALLLFAGACLATVGAWLHFRYGPAKR